MDLQKKINKLIRRELKRCQYLYRKFERELEIIEEGSLSERKGTYNWCYRVNGKQFSHKVKDVNQLLRLKKRQFIKRGLPVLEKRIKNCRDYLRRDVIYDPVEINNAMPEQYHGLKNMDVFLEGDINLEEWSAQKYERGNMYPEKKIYQIDNETWVRSKSETMISMRLVERGFKVRHEPAVRVGDKTLYPDFEIALEHIRRIVYYEHLGMMDNPEYAMKALNKLDEYAQNGIYLGYNLVISYETRNKPLTLADIDKVIDQLLKMDEE